MSTPLGLALSLVNTRPSACGRVMKTLMVAIVLALAPMMAAAQSGGSQNESPKQVVERFCKMAAEGMGLSPEHWDEFNEITVYPAAWSTSGGMTVIRGYTVGDAVEHGDSAEVSVEYAVWGNVDLSSFLFLRTEGLVPDEPVKRNALLTLKLSDKVGQSSAATKAPLRWRLAYSISGGSVSVDTAIRYVSEMRGKLHDPVLKYNAERTLVALRAISAGAPALFLQSAGAVPESPSQVFQQFFKLESAGEGLTPDGCRELARFFVFTPKPIWRRIHIVDVVDVGEALIDGGTAYVGVHANSLGELDRSLRLFGSPSCKPSPASGCYGDTGGFGFTSLLSEKPWNETGEESVGSLAWRIYGDHPEEPRITLDAAIEYLTKRRSETTDPIVRRNADEALAKLRKLR
jgi:hypothetical protein